ncbi:MAG TPA: hypothetical protein VJ783_31840 [Pirellulales bacterium]|nr:hypothetical protein [Pirellulales bacterium]
MRFESRTFLLAKDVDEPAQCQDAFALDAERGTASVADGVSSTIFSGPWANILVRSMVQSPRVVDDQEAFRAWLDEQRSAWRGGIDMGRLTWYQRPKMIDGAMSTLLWTELTPTQTADDGHATQYHLRALALGDTCLFHLRGDECLKHFPVEKSGDFGLNPAVIGSVDRQADHLLEFNLYEAECPPGDWLVLATDALALWAMTRGESGEPVDWRSYWEMPDDQWRQEITSLREANQMRYDDTTLVLLRVIEERPAPVIEPVEEAPPEATEALAEQTVEAQQAEGTDETVAETSNATLYVPATMDEPPAATTTEDQVEPVPLADVVEPPAETVEQAAETDDRETENISQAIAAGMEAAETPEEKQDRM